MKQFKTSTGQDLPKVINWLANREHDRLGVPKEYKDNDKLFFAFSWSMSKVFNGDNHEIWEEINENNFQPFYDQFPICKNSRGQILPEEIQVEIVEERLRQGINENHEIWPKYKFDWNNSVKGTGYWFNVIHSTDGSQTSKKTETKSDDTFTQGEIVEVRDNDLQDWFKREYITIYKGKYYALNTETDTVMNWNFIRKIQPLELTLPELLTIAEEVKGTKVKLKS